MEFSIKDFFSNCDQIRSAQKWTFPLRISSVIVTDLVAFTEEILHGKLHLFVQWLVITAPKLTDQNSCIRLTVLESILKKI